MSEFDMTQNLGAHGEGYHAFLSAAREIEAIIRARPHASDADIAEGYLYLAGMWQFHLERQFKGGGTDRPCFIRVMDSHRSWGFPTPDHHYYAAQIDGSGEYKISCQRGHTIDYCFEVLSGLVGDDGVVGERIDALEASNLQIDADGRFELIIGGSQKANNWLKAGPSATTLFVRQTSNDWRTEHATPMLIERLDQRTVRGFQRPSNASVQQLFQQAARQLVDQVRFLDGFCRNWSQALPLNELPSPSVGPADAGYFPGQYNTKCRFSLSPGEGLLLTMEASTARYQSVSLGHPFWFNCLHPRELQSTLNLSQSVASRDGKLRYVISAEDPGICNWLDTAGQHEGFVFIRYQQVRGPSPSKPSLEKIALSELQNILPDGEKLCSESNRDYALRLRRLSLDRRFF